MTTALPAPIRTQDEIDKLTGEVIRAAMLVHSRLGPGLLEKAYHPAQQQVLAKWGHVVESEVSIPIAFDDIVVNPAFRLDLIVDRCVIVEVKSVPRILGIHHAQVITYLKLTGYPVALLLNFNVRSLRQGIRRFVSETYAESPRVSVDPVGPEETSGRETIRD